MDILIKNGLEFALNSSRSRGPIEFLKRPKITTLYPYLDTIQRNQMANTIFREFLKGQMIKSELITRL